MLSDILFCFFVCSDTCDFEFLSFKYIHLKNRFGFSSHFFAWPLLCFEDKFFSKLTVFSVPSNLHAKHFIRYTNRTFQLIQQPLSKRKIPRLKPILMIIMKWQLWRPVKKKRETQLSSRRFQKVFLTQWIPWSR